MRTIKIILAVGIFICMFLPLSQCSSSFSSHKKYSENIQTAKSVSEANIPSPENHVIRVTNRMPESFEDYIFTLGFILPLLCCIPYFKNRKFHLAQLCVQTLFSGWFLFEVYILVYSVFTPLYGGYILTLLSIAFFIISLFELFVYMRAARFNVRQNIK